MAESFSSALILFAVILFMFRDRPARPSRWQRRLEARYALEEAEGRKHRSRTARRKQEAAFFTSFGHPQVPRQDAETTG